jgi:hypothetical protein
LSTLRDIEIVRFGDFYRSRPECLLEDGTTLFEAAHAPRVVVEEGYVRHVQATRLFGNPCRISSFSWRTTI